MRLVAALLLLLTAVACGDERTPQTSTPSSSAPVLNEREQVVDTLMRAIEAGDCDRVKDVVLTPSEIDCGAIVDSAGMLEMEGVDLDGVRYEAGEIAGDSSTVTITWSKDLPEEAMDVQRVDGEWLVVFDSAA